jgi:hypothetical protein
VVVRSDLPEGLNPVAQIEYPPARPGAKPVRQRYELKERCRGCLFHHPVRVPKEAGKAQVTLSFDAWKEGKLGPATFEVPIVDEETKAKE